MRTIFTAKIILSLEIIFVLILLQQDHFHILILIFIMSQVLSLDINKQSFSLGQLYINETGGLVSYSLCACFLFS